MRTGLIGGTFDPVHRGHLDVAEAARKALDLDRIWLLPAGTPSHRTAPAASAQHRFAMVALAVAPYPHLLVSDADLRHDEPVFTDDTLARWTREHGVKPGDLFFITGADAFAGIRTWRNYPGLLDRAHFVVVSRPGHPATRLQEELPELADRMRPASVPAPASPAILLVDAATTDISSTRVRQEAAAGHSVENVVPGDVAAYIRKYGIYGGR